MTLRCWISSSSAAYSMAASREQISPDSGFSDCLIFGTMRSRPQQAVGSATAELLLIVVHEVLHQVPNDHGLQAKLTA